MPDEDPLDTAGLTAFWEVLDALTPEQRARLREPAPELHGETTYTHLDVCDGCLALPGFCLCGGTP